MEILSVAGVPCAAWVSHPAFQAQLARFLGLEIPSKRALVPLGVFVTAVKQWTTEGRWRGRGGDMGTSTPQQRGEQGCGMEVLAHLRWKGWGVFVWVGEYFEVLWKHCLLAPCLCFQVGRFFYLHFTRSVGLAAVFYKKMFPVANGNCIQKPVFDFSMPVCSFRRKGLMHYFLFYLLSFKGKDSNCAIQNHIKYLTNCLGHQRRPEGAGRWKGGGKVPD